MPAAAACREAAQAFHDHEMDVGPDQWERWLDEVSRLSGIKNLDGDQNVDGYSLDLLNDDYDAGLSAADVAARLRVQGAA